MTNEDFFKHTGVKDEKEGWRSCTDPAWRLDNLYYIKDKSGAKIQFVFNIFQRMLYSQLWFFNIILKARQLGITTFFCIIYLDAILFDENKAAHIIAHTEKDAKKIFETKIKFAFDNLPPFIREKLEIKKDSTEELSFKNGSSISVSVSTRSGTVQYLHISEFGWTCLKFPDKAEEIITGAVNSVEQGCYVSIESTAHTREGWYFNLCNTARRNKLANKVLSKLEFRFFFFPWWMEPTYILKSKQTMTTELKEYFSQLKLKEGITLTPEQENWYVAKWEVNRDKMRQEYPSTPDEAFSTSNEGAYYAREILKTMEEKRIRAVPYDRRLPVDTWWDLGWNDLNVILFTQTLNSEIRFIDCYANSQEPLAHYVKYLQNKEYIYKVHHLPHDVAVNELGTGKSRLEILQGMNLRNIEVQPMDVNLQDGIELTRAKFNRFYFDEVKCAKLIDAIINYRKAWDDKTGQFKNKPLHNEASHYADALRLVGVMQREDYIEQDKEPLYEKYGIVPRLF